MTILTQLAKWRELNAKRTRGEWFSSPYHPGLVETAIQDDNDATLAACDSADDGRFIAQAPQILAALITAVELCQMQREALEESLPIVRIYCGDGLFTQKVEQTLAKAEEVL